MTLLDLLHLTAFGIGWAVIGAVLVGLTVALGAFAVGEWRYRHRKVDLTARVGRLPDTHPAVRPVRDNQEPRHG